MSGQPPISARAAAAGLVKSARAQKRDSERQARLVTAPPEKAQLKIEDEGLERITLTPDIAAQLLERNDTNRPLSDEHVARIARLIREGQWKFNGDTIKISTEHEVLDGQHRLWAVVEAQRAVETVVVYGLQRDVFATIDTVRRLRTGSDIVALAGARSYRQQISTALTWLLRWQRGTIESFRAPENRIENADIEAAFAAHPGMVRAAEAAMKLRAVANPGVITFCYYAMATQNQDIADEFLHIMADPSGVGVNHPFFRLRSYYLTDKLKKKDTVMSIALTFKAANAIRRNKQIQLLIWRGQGDRPEAYPVLDLK